MDPVQISPQKNKVFIRHFKIYSINCLVVLYIHIIFYINIMNSNKLL